MTGIENVMKFCILLLMISNFVVATERPIVLFSFDTLGNLVYATSKDSKVLDLGAISIGKKKTIAVLFVNTDNKREVQIISMRSSCSCLSFFPQKKTLILKPGKGVDLPITIDSAGYFGTVKKSIHFRVAQEGESANLLLPVKFYVSANQEMDLQQTEQNVLRIENVQYLEYRHNLYPKISTDNIYFFASQNCTECDYAKRFLLPALFPKSEKKHIIILVNADISSGFELLQDIQQKLNVKLAGDFPVLYYNGTLTYGNPAIKKLLEQNKQKEQ